MEYSARSGSLEKQRSQCIVVPVFNNNEMSAQAKKLDAASQGQIRKILNRGDIRGKSGQSLLLHDVQNINAQRVLIVGLGDRESIDTTRFINAVRTVITRIKPLSITNMICCLTDVPCGDKSIGWKTLRLVEQFENGFYQYLDMKGKSASDVETAGNKGNTLARIDFFTSDRATMEEINNGISRGSALAEGLALAKDIANTPANICTPAYLAEQAGQLASRFESIEASVLEEKDMEEMGMGAFLSVSQGSEQPGKLVILHYRGTDDSVKPHAIVGKGITFDTGGISLKPGAGMHEMIYDMCGAASVLGTLATIARQALAINVVGVLAAAENMPSGKAGRPGDIVNTMSGQTVEILNTDAEGRLVLCDALTCIEKFEPVSVIDIATLTGGCVVALGRVATGLFSNDDQLARQLSEAGEDTCDRVWRLPIWEEYQPQLASAFADMANVGGREASSITAACFLARFTKKYRWAHLDIAGTGFQGSGSNKGSTGRPIPLLTQYLDDRAAETE